MLRSQHFLHTTSTSYTDVIKLGSLKFWFDDGGSLYAMTLDTGRDKNHPNKIQWERAAYCTCKQGITCLPHHAWRITKEKRDKYGHTDDTPLITIDNTTKLMPYQKFLIKLKNAYKAIGLNPDDVANHSLRSGGASEMAVEGWMEFEIQRFGRWESINSVKHYIQGNCADLKQFINIPFDIYRAMRINKRIYNVAPWDDIKLRNIITNHTINKNKKLMNQYKNKMYTSRMTNSIIARHQ
jgi:hypothetical protein